MSKRMAVPEYPDGSKSASTSESPTRTTFIVQRNAKSHLPVRRPNTLTVIEEEDELSEDYGSTDPQPEHSSPNIEVGHQGHDINQPNHSSAAVPQRPRPPSFPVSLESELVILNSRMATAEEPHSRPIKRQRLAHRSRGPRENAGSLFATIQSIQSDPTYRGFRRQGNGKTVATKPTSLPTFLQLREEDALVSTEEKISVPITQIEEIPQELDAVPMWISNPAIKNPDWYDQALCNEIRPSERIAVLASIDLLQDRSLFRILEQSGFDLIERESAIEGADLVLSARIAIIFRQFGSLPSQLSDVRANLKQAATHFRFVFLVFEVIAYSVLEKRTDQAIPSVNPLSPPVLKALAALRRGIALSIQTGEGDILGSVELVFAIGGAREVAHVMKAIAEQDMEEVRQSVGTEGAVDYNGRQWLLREGASESSWAC